MVSFDFIVIVIGAGSAGCAVAAVMPNMTAGNTNAPAMMIGRRTRQIIVDEVKLCEYKELAA